MQRNTHGKERRRMEALRVTALLTLVIGLLAVPSTAGAQAPGGLTQLAGSDGCYADFSWIGILPNCTDTDGMSQGHNVVLSPDGKQAYELAPEYCCGGFGNSIVIFDRDTTTGALTRKPGTQGCVSDDPVTGCDSSVRSMRNPRGVAFSNDGATMYVASISSNGITVFTRNTSNGTLSQKLGALGCIVENNTAGGEANTCADGHMLVNPENLVVSPDGKHLYAASYSSDAVAAFGINGTNGSLLQTPGTCVQNTAVSPCSDARALSQPFAITISPGGSRVYVGSHASNSITTLIRDANTGALTQLGDGTNNDNGCVNSDGSDNCTNLGSDMDDVYDLAITKDPGSHVYAAIGATNRILLFDRQSNGGIVRRAGSAGCVSDGATTGCTTGRQLSFPHGLALSPDERHLYVASYNSSAVVELVRADNGSLTPSPTALGCITAGSVPNCTTGSNIPQSRRVAISGDGRSLYATGDHTLVAFRRDANPPTCNDGSATIGAGQSIVLNLPCTDDPGDPLAIAIVTAPNGGSVGSVDQAARQVSFTAFQGFSGATSFTFKASSNGVSSATRTFTINVTGSGGGGGGGGGGGVTPPPSLGPFTVTNKWSAFPNFTTVRGLSVKTLPAGTKVVTTCKTKKKRLQKKRCPYKSKTVTTPTARAKLNLARPFRKRKLPLGTIIKITITAPGFIGKVFTYTVRRRALPAFKLQCLAPGATKPGKCSS